MKKPSAQKQPYGPIGLNTPSRRKCRARLKELDAMLNNEVERSAVRDDDDAVEDWLRANVGERCQKHPVHAITADQPWRTGQWDYGLWGDSNFFWFDDLKHASLFLLFFGGRSSAHDMARRKAMRNWMTYQ